MGSRVALQGNLDPAILFGSHEAIARETRAVLDAFGAGPGHVFNLGPGISQHTPIDAVEVLVRTVHDHSRAARG